MLRPLLLAALASALAACSASPSPPPDAAPDAPGLDAGAEAAADTLSAPDAEAAVDAPELEAGPDAHQPDAPSPPDAGTDAAPDAPGLDVVAEAAADAPELEVGPDAPPACTSGETRCAAAGGAAIEYCVGGTWLPNACPDLGLPGGAGVCAGGQCYTCRRAEGGPGCSATTFCAEDVDCYRVGQGRCVAGQCAHRGAIRCTRNAGCAAWATPTASVPCVMNATLATMTCGSSAARCTHDPMCPAGFRCDVATGFCAER